MAHWSTTETTVSFLNWPRFSEPADRLCLSERGCWARRAWSRLLLTILSLLPCFFDPGKIPTLFLRPLCPGLMEAFWPRAELLLISDNSGHSLPTVSHSPGWTCKGSLASETGRRFAGAAIKGFLQNKKMGRRW